MITINAKWQILGAACVAAASLAACHGDRGAPPPPPPPAATSFTAFAKSTFAANANTTPVSLDGITFNFDSNEDPTAFDTLVTAGSF